MLNFMQLLTAHLTHFWVLPAGPLCPLGSQQFLPVYLLANLFSGTLNSVFKLLVKMQKSTGPWMEPCGAPWVTGHQPDVPFETVAHISHNTVIQQGCTFYPEGFCQRQYQKFCWIPKRLYLPAFLDQLSGWPCYRGRSRSTSRSYLAATYDCIVLQEFFNSSPNILFHDVGILEDDSW